MVRFVRPRLKNIRKPADATKLGRELRVMFSDAWIKGLLRDIGKRAERAGSKPWERLGRVSSRGDGWRMDAAEYDADKLLDQWSRDAFKRIKSVRDEVGEALRKDVVEALDKGTDPATLAARWVRDGIPVEFGTLEGRARVIAQNQLGILHAKVQSERARSVGVESFVWRTQGDQRVRDKHRDLDGEEFEYADPPSEGLPGQPINCRCWAESVIPDELLESSGFGFGIAPEQGGD